MKKIKYTRELLEEVVKKSKNYSDTLRNLGAKRTQGTIHKYIKNLIKKYNINIDHFVYSTKGIHAHNKLHYSEVLVLNRLKNRKESAEKLRRAMIESGIEYKCIDCNISNIYNNKQIRLEIHHKNKNSFDNSKDNVVFLCPNCHSQRNDDHK